MPLIAAIVLLWKYCHSHSFSRVNFRTHFKHALSFCRCVTGFLHFYSISVFTYSKGKHFFTWKWISKLKLFTFTVLQLPLVFWKRELTLSMKHGDRDYLPPSWKFKCCFFLMFKSALFSFLYYFQWTLEGVRGGVGGSVGGQLIRGQCFVVAPS